jgi:Glycosyltransferase like family 2
VSAPTATPFVAVVVPCFNESGYIDRLLEGLLPQVAANERWRVVLVDDSSTDETSILVEAAASRQVIALHGRYGSPGGSRSAGIAAALAKLDVAPEWIVTVDADVDVSPTWLADWDSSLQIVDVDERVGAVNGGERQDHLFADLPNAAIVSHAFGLGLVASEHCAGITNLNGVNHAVRVSAYLTAGPYVQPIAPGVDGPEFLAGEDWDLGVRLRRAGYRIGETPATVIDRGRRLLADVHAYVSGEAYEGAFRRISSQSGPQDIDASTVDELVNGALERTVRHFLLKPLLAEAVAPSELRGLSTTTLNAMTEWMRAWPHPTFEESRNGFVFGRLERFSAAVNERVRNDLNLTTDAALARLRA